MRSVTGRAVITMPEAYPDERSEAGSDDEEVADSADGSTDAAFEALLREAAHVSEEHASGAAGGPGVDPVSRSRRRRPLQNGDRVAQRFVIESVAGWGGMGTVYKARDSNDGALVALKLTHGAGAQEQKRFERESAVLSQLRHPGIVRYITHGATADGRGTYLAMEWLDGEDLAERLDRGPFATGDAIALVGRTAEALSQAHARGIVHRDIKPANLFLVGGRLDDVRLLDFGVARPATVSRALTRSGATVGTPGYMAPEQVTARSSVDARVDVFALGCVLFECLTGQPAFVGEHPAGVMAKIVHGPRPVISLPDAPPALLALIDRMLARDPDERPRDASVVAVELAKLGHFATAASIGSSAPSTPRPRSIWKRAVQVGLACSVFVAIGIAAIANFAPTRRTQPVVDGATRAHANDRASAAAVIAPSEHARAVPLSSGSDDASVMVAATPPQIVPASASSFATARAQAPRGAVAPRAMRERSPVTPTSTTGVPPRGLVNGSPVIE